MVDEGGTVRGITTHQRAEQTLRVREAQLQTILDSLTEGLVVADLEGNLFHWNPAALAMHGFASMEECQRRLPDFADTFELSTPEDGILPLEQWPLARILRGETLNGWEVHLARPGTDWQRVFSYSGRLARNQDGQPLLAVVAVSDITERHRAEQEIQRLASFPQMNPHPVLEIDADGRITYFNKAALAALGPTGQEEDLQKFLPGDLPEILAQAKQTGGKSFQREVMVNGAVFLETFSCVEPFKVVRLYAIDITDREQIEAALRRAKDEWERTFDAVPDLIFILDQQHRIVRCNRAMSEALGVEPKHLVGRTCYEAVHGLQEPPDFCPHSKLLQDGQAHTAEVSELGREFLVTVSPFIFAGGRIVGSVHVARDITERKQAEVALRESEERFRTLADAIPQLAWTADSDGYITWYNQRWYEYTGTTAADMEGWGWQSVHDPKVLPKVLEQWRASLATGRPFDMVFPLRGADGQFRDFLTRVMPIKDSDGQVTQWFGTNTDITERQQAEEALRRSNHRLDLLAETANRLLGRASPQKVVDTICLKVMEFLHCDVFFNFLQDEQEGRLYLNAYAGIPEEEARRIQCLDYGVAVCGCAAQDRCRIVTEDIFNTNDPRTDLVKSFGIQAYACHPLMVEGRVLGTLSFGTRSRSHFTQEELTLMNAVADQVAIAMDRQQAEVALRRLNEELEQRVEERTAELQEMVAQLEEEMHDRRRAEEQAASRGRLYRLLSLVNETIVRAQDQEGLFRRICRIMMEEGDFLLCWIGRVDREAGVVRAAAQFALLDDYPQNITVSLADVPEGRGPTGVAVREGRWDVCPDVAQDPRMAPWRGQALARGFRSSAAFPLFMGGRVEGVLTLYSGQKDFFNQGEVGLLNSLAQNLSFAMESMDREAKRRQAEEEILRLNEALEQRVQERTAELAFANRELEAFTYSVSHDLKAPLRAIQGFSRILLRERASGLDEEGLRLLDVIVSNTRMMSRLIDDLLALSRLGRQQIIRSQIDLAALARGVFAELQAQEPDRDLRLVVSDLPPAWGEPSLLKQVMMNLLGNAIKYTRPRETAVIAVDGHSEGRETIYSIKDNGIGFDERYAQKMFGVFQRLHSGQEYEGTGVGLAIVQRIIHRHGGRVWAEGKVGEGATLYFALPKQ
jgi:PAS domain S-box-containing protein